MIHRYYHPGQSGPGSNYNEEVLHTSKNLITGASPSNTVLCHTWNTKYACVLASMVRTLYVVYYTLSASSATMLDGDENLPVQKDKNQVLF